MTEVSAEERMRICAVILQFYWLVDHGHAAESASLFTESAAITFGPGTPSPGTVRGGKIRELMTLRGQQTHVTTRHVLSNIVLDKRPDGSVDAHSILTLYRSDGASRDSYPASIADVEEHLRPGPGGWLIQERTITPVFALPPRQVP
jgi:hypothetical protein